MSDLFTDLQEPRKVFLGFLITRLMEVEEAIYNAIPCARSHSIIMMKGILDSLDKADKEALKPQYDKLTHLRNNSASVEEIEKTYSEITDYLHSKYLQEILGAHPRIKEPGHLA